MRPEVDASHSVRFDTLGDSVAQGLSVTGATMFPTPCLFHRDEALAGLGLVIGSRL